MCRNSRYHFSHSCQFVCPHYDKANWTNRSVDVLNKGLRACLRCSLIKTFAQVSFILNLKINHIMSHKVIPPPVLFDLLKQFVETGCENCDFLSMENISERVLEVSLTRFSLKCRLLTQDLRIMESYTDNAPTWHIIFSAPHHILREQ